MKKCIVANVCNPKSVKNYAKFSEYVLRYEQGRGNTFPRTKKMLNFKESKFSKTPDQSERPYLLGEDGTYFGDVEWIIVSHHYRKENDKEEKEILVPIYLVCIIEPSRYKQKFYKFDRMPLGYSEAEEINAVEAARIMHIALTPEWKYVKDYAWNVMCHEKDRNKLRSMIDDFIMGKTSELDLKANSNYPVGIALCNEYGKHIYLFEAAILFRVKYYLDDECEDFDENYVIKFYAVDTRLGVYEIGSYCPYAF